MRSGRVVLEGEDSMGMCDEGMGSVEEMEG